MDAQPPANPAQVDGLPFPRRVRAVASLLICIVTLVTGGAMATVGLPTMAREFNTEPAAAIWLVNGFQIALVICLLPAAAAGVRIGQRALFQIGLIVFLIAAGCSALSSSIGWLTASRILQGMGSAAVLSVTAALVRHTYPSKNISAAVAINAFTVALSSGIGPIAGSFILTWASWPWLFAASIPPGLVGLACSISLPDNTPRKAPFDSRGAILAGLTFGLFVIGMEQLGMRPQLATGTLVISLASGILLLRHTKNRSHPILPLDLLTMPRLAFASSSSVLCFAANTMVLTALPFHLIDDLSVSQLDAGFLLSIWPFALAPAAVATGWLLTRMREEVLCLIGSSAMAIGMFIMVFAPVGAELPGIIFGAAFAGLGFALFQSPNNKMMILSVPLERSGGASVIQAMSREFGIAIGAGMLGLIFNLATGASSYGILIGALLATMTSALSAFRLRARDR
ncbi:MAG: MFS transporter [Rhizobiaceae bacterium]|nr:MFS transporter [Rhizobiaceae bacterium]